MTDERFIIGENGIPRPNPALPEEPPEQEPEQFRGESFARRVASYLLGQMSEEESEQFEDECFEQKSWPSQIKLVEDDLIDAYLHKELPPAQRQLFEQNYLTTEARQERVRVAAALLRQVCERDTLVELSGNSAREGNTWAERLKAFWLGGGKGLRVASALALLIVVVGGSWLYLSRVRPPRAVATQILTSTIVNRSPGGAPQTIKLPPDADALIVPLALPDHAPRAPHYRVELDDVEGETMNLTVEGQDAQTVSVLIPAARLSRGQQYVLTLFPLGEDREEQPGYGTYTFVVE
jgi:hypothetical protein